MSSHALGASPVPLEPGVIDSSLDGEQELRRVHARQAERLRLLWNRREFLLRAAVLGLLASTLVAFIIPRQYTSRTRLMPPDPQSASGTAMMAAIAAKSSSGLGSIAADLLGVRTTGALFVGILRSETTQDRLVQQFDLTRVYGSRVEASAILDENTSISEDRKSGIITISVTDRSPSRAAALAHAYVDQLNSLVVELSTSSAHRERQFLEDRLRIVKQDLDDVSDQFAQFSSTSRTLDIQQEGKAMLDAAANLEAQMTAAQAQLEGLRQLYTDSNPRVQALSARVAEIRRQLATLSGTKNTGPGFSDESSSKMPYPSIRNLPLLGVKYADYYRRSKVQETLYQLLTEQYELAKVEEAKETPSVKILDRAKPPLKHSFPPRLWITLGGTLCAFAAAVAWVIGTGCWNAADAQDPRKVVMQEVAQQIKASVPWAPHNGNHSGSRAQQIWTRLMRRRARIIPMDQ